MRCIVTGVAGFVGSSICDRLLKDGHDVTGIDCFVEYYPRFLKEKNLDSALKSPKFKFVEANLLEVDLSSVVNGAQWIFHQAAQAGVRASWGEYFKSYTDNNVLATQRLLDACKGSKTLTKLVFASSSSVYGNAEKYPTIETDLPQPISPYGVTKLASEHLMLLYASQFEVPTVSLRYFTVFGPRQRPDMAFHKFIRSGLAKDEIVVFGNGEQERDFTYIDDIVEANIISAQRGPAGAVFNIGGGTHATVNQTLAIIEREIGPLNVNRVETQKGDVVKTSAETSRAQNVLGFKPQISLHEGLKREIEWMQELFSQRFYM